MIFGNKDKSKKKNRKKERLEALKKKFKLLMDPIRSNPIQAPPEFNK